jgi:pentapeptide MXKDX repeat protein
MLRTRLGATSVCQAYNFARRCIRSKKETKMKRLITICFALSLLMCGVAVAQDTMKQDNMKADTSAKAVKVTGKIGDDGKTFVSDKDGKSWTINNPDAVKGHEGHHVTLTAHVDADKNEVHVTSLKMAADSMKKDNMQK